MYYFRLRYYLPDGALAAPGGWWGPASWSEIVTRYRGLGGCAEMEVTKGKPCSS